MTSNRISDAKAVVAGHHKAGYKMLIVGQPLAGKDVPKATYMSCLNLFNPMNLLNLLQNNKIATTIKVLGDFPMDANRNRFIHEAIECGADYVFFMDMDQTFPSNAIELLFETISDERPIVSGMYFLKQQPYSPVMGRYVEWEHEMLDYKSDYEELGFVHEDGRQLCMWRPFTYFDPNGKPFLADVIGLGCVLMKTSVFRDMEKPYFHYSGDPRPDTSFRQMDEVMPFCAQANKLGIPIYIDPRVQCGHIMTMESNLDLFQNYRDSSFDAAEKSDPKRFASETKPKFIDTREEQKL